MMATRTMPLRTGNPLFYSGDRPVFRGPSRRLSQGTPSAAEMTTAKRQLAGMGVAAMAIAAGGTWVGIRTGLREKGFLSVAGWTVGIASALTALTSLGILAVIPFIPSVPVTTPVVSSTPAAA